MDTFTWITALTLLALGALGVLAALATGRGREYFGLAEAAPERPLPGTPGYGPLQRVATLACPATPDGVHIALPWDADRECFACLPELTREQRLALIEAIAYAHFR